MTIVKGEDPTNINDDTSIYLGSHNFSPSAWGHIDHEQEAVSINNWEFGVVFGPQKDSKAMKE